jgi:cytochrome c oxidase subunit 1
VMFSGLLFMDTKTGLSIAIIISGAGFMVASLYKWLTTPLEDHH